MGHAVEVLLCLGACKAAPPAARALLSTLAKLFAMAHAPGSALCAELRVRRVRARRPWRPAGACSAHANKSCVCQLVVPVAEKPGHVQICPACASVWYLLAKAWAENLPCSGRQGALGAACIAWGSGLLRSGAGLRAIGLALPAELLPYAAAQLLPVLLLPPKRLLALDVPRQPLGGTIRVSDVLSDLLVSKNNSSLRGLS